MFLSRSPYGDWLTFPDIKLLKQNAALVPLSAGGHGLPQHLHANGRTA